MFQRKVTLEDSRIKYRTSKLALYPPYFYMMDGSMPFVYKGDIESWKATNTTSKAFYSLAIPISSDSLMVRTRSSRTKEDVIGIVSLNKINNIELTDQLLEKQVDGYFDTDGRLIFNHQKQKAVYIYFYRNEYLLINSDLSLDVKGKTIDDTDKVKVEVRDIGSNKKLSNPYSITNKNASTYGKLLLIQSGLRGKNETLNMWNNSSIIDAYDLEKRTYLFSFLIPDRDKYGVIDFHLEKNYLIVFQNTYIRKYKLDPKWFDL